MNACINSDKDLFDEITKMRRTNEVVASSMDGKLKTSQDILKRSIVSYITQ